MVSTFYPYTVQEDEIPKNLQITINHPIYVNKNLLDPVLRRRGRAHNDQFGEHEHTNLFCQGR